MFSKEDVSNFLRAVSRNKILRFSVIAAHNEQGRLTGYTVLRFGGKREEAARIRREFDEAFRARFAERKIEISANTEKFSHILPGQSILTKSEQAAIILDFLKKHGIAIKFFPTAGQVYNPAKQKYEKAV